MNTVVVRHAVEKDAPRILALRTAVFAETDFMLWEPAEFNETAADEKARITRLNAAPNSRFLVAVSGEAPIGFCFAAGGGVNRVRHSATLAIGVLQSHWGQGVGKALLANIIGWSEAARVTRLELTVHTTNLRAIGLYLGAGFEIEGRRRNSLRVNGRYVDEYLMSRLAKLSSSASRAKRHPDV